MLVVVVLRRDCRCFLVRSSHTRTHTQATPQPEPEPLPQASLRLVDVIDAVFLAGTKLHALWRASPECARCIESDCTIAEWLSAADALARQHTYMQLQRRRFCFAEHYWLHAVDVVAFDVNMFGPLGEGNILRDYCEACPAHWARQLCMRRTSVCAGS